MFSPETVGLMNRDYDDLVFDDSEVFQQIRL
jgi:hypothetical protein